MAPNSVSNSRHFKGKRVLSRMRQPFFAGFHALNFDSRELIKPICTNFHIQHRKAVVLVCLCTNVFFLCIFRFARFARVFFIFVHFGLHALVQCFRFSFCSREMTYSPVNDFSKIYYFVSLYSECVEQVKKWRESSHVYLPF